MYVLQTSVMGGEWRSLFESKSWGEIDEKRNAVRIMPMTATQIIRKCEHCGEEVGIGQLAEFENPNCCPNCMQSFEKH